MDTRLDLHALVPLPDGSAFLAAADGRLPTAQLSVRADHPAIGSVVRFLRDELGLDAPVLETQFRWDVTEEGQPIPALVRSEAPPDGWVVPSGFAWRALVAAPTDLPEALRPRADQLIGEIRTGAPPPDLRPQWARPGWFARAAGWSTARLAEAGRPPTGPFEQAYLRGISAVLRAPTEAGTVFMKAVFPLFHDEPRISQLLAARFPGATATIVAIEPDEGWLLMEDFGGEAVRESSTPGALEAGLGALVRIQRELVDGVAPFVATGCPDRPLDGLAADLERALADPGTDLDRAPAEVARIVEHTAGAAARVGALRFPTSLVHGDFHTSNVVIADGRPIVFDWSDAAIGSPVLDLVTWLRDLDSAADREAATVAWIDAWSGAPGVRAPAVRSAMEDILAVGAAYQVVSYAAIAKALEPATRYTVTDSFRAFVDQLDEAARA